MHAAIEPCHVFVHNLKGRQNQYIFLIPEVLTMGTDLCTVCIGGDRMGSSCYPCRSMHVQTDLTYPHTSVLGDMADKVRELDK